MTILDRKLKEIIREKERCPRQDCKHKKDGSCCAVVICAVKYCDYERDEK